MQVTIEDFSSVKKSLHIEIPQERVSRELDLAYGKLKKTAKIKGFRPGKAPRSVLELNLDGPYAYDATIEIKPEIGDIDFKGLNLVKTKYKVNEKEVESQLKALQKNLAQQKPIEEDRPAREGDHVMITYEGLKDGKPFTETQRTENFTLKIGDGSILKDFDAGLIGMKAGESKSLGW